MKRPDISVLRIMRTISVAILVSLLATRATGQSLMSPSVQKALQKQIVLDQSNAPLKSVLAALTQQTGIVFEADNCLLEREMTLSTAGQTGLQVLTAIVNLYDWRWVETDNGHIAISRVTPPMPTTLPEMQEAVGRSLPVDFRTYLGIGVSVESVTVPPNSPADAGFKQLKHSRPEQAFKIFTQDRRSTIAPIIEANLMQELEKQPLLSGDVAYKNWSPSLRRCIMAKLILSLLDSTDFYWKTLAPYQSDITRAQIRLYGGTLDIGTLYHKPNTQEGIIFQGFGLVIPEELAKWNAQHKADSQPQP